MKKITAIILVALACVMTLSSCALVTPDPLDLAKKYDDASYTVEMTVDSEGIRELLEDEFNIDPEDPVLTFKYEDIEQIVFVKSTASKNPPSGFYVYYSDADAAKADVESLEGFMNKEENEELFKDIVVYNQGKMVFFGMDECWSVVFK